MAEIITMPRLSDTMQEGTVAKWHKKVGDKVDEGDLLAEIETDKATMEFESYVEGTLLYIGINEGETAPVDSVLAILGEEGEDYKSLLEEAKSGGDKKESSSATEESKPSKESDKDPEKEVKSEKSVASSSDGGRIKASPLAKKMAEDKGIDISQVEGSGEGGRIVKRDIDDFKAPKSASPSAVGLPEVAYTTENVSQMRKTIARRLSDSKFTAPHFYLTMEIGMDAALEARKAINASGDVKISVNDMIIKACAMALRQHPAINSSWLGDTIRRNNHINVGVAVAVDDGLLVPVVKNADHKGFKVIGEEVREFAAKAREKKLQPADWEGNTFTISNLGMFGIDEFTAIINPPDACILAVGATKETPVVRDGQLVVGNVMKVTLSCDHRIVDGVTGAKFLQTVKAMLENPVSMLV
ncbi:MAG: pyruvate dehydrogenase complex dihydrolipoamide acetyltransferase [Cryomorphaceae bacterium]|nr:pyruvate dehydrogenase complex dihydrolipoamide acetyltransferase [Cryomorphaceae bacterium]